MNDPVLYRARGLAKVYQSNRVAVPVLKGLDLELRRGEILSIVGQSGVGKSTLLNILGLLDVPTSGVLEYQARGERLLNLAGVSPRTKARIRNEEFGFVFQFYHLLPDLTVLENVLLPAMIRLSRGQYRAQEPELRERAGSILSSVGLEDRSDFWPAQLSGGERQRAAIARALMNEPQVVFCDEPTGNLDVATGAKIHELILKLNSELHVTFVLVTHDETLASLAHRKLVMRDGVFVS